MKRDRAREPGRYSAPYRDSNQRPRAGLRLIYRRCAEAIQTELKLPTGYYVQWGGQFENLERASRRFMIVVPLALFLIFVLLYTKFNSIRPALMIYFNIPLAATGGIIALFLRGLPFSISAGVGFIALFGVAVLNGVVLMSYILQMREQGMSAKEAAVHGAEIRLRPVLMTALVASLGFVPMAFLPWRRRGSAETACDSSYRRADYIDFTDIGGVARPLRVGRRREKREKAIRRSKRNGGNRMKLMKA